MNLSLTLLRVLAGPVNLDLAAQLGRAICVLYLGPIVGGDRNCSVSNAFQTLQVALPAGDYNRRHRSKARWSEGPRRDLRGQASSSQLPP